MMRWWPWWGGKPKPPPPAAPPYQAWRLGGLILCVALLSVLAGCVPPRPWPPVTPVPPVPPTPPTITVDVRATCGTADVPGARVTLTPTDPVRPALDAPTNAAGFARFVFAPIQRAVITSGPAATCLGASIGDQVIGLVSHVAGGAPDAFRVVLRPAARPGMVRATGRVWTDDAGGWNPLCASMFWLAWGVEHDAARTERNLAALDGFDCVRIFAEVGGVSWEDRTINPLAGSGPLARAVDAAYAHGLRSEITVVAGGTGHEDAALATVLAVVADRREKVLAVEVANEHQFPDPARVRPFVVTLRARFPGLLVSPFSAGDPAEYTPWLDVLSYVTPHTDRSDAGDGKWRQIRQIYDYKAFSVPCSHDEPPGPMSSVATQEAPIHLALSRAVAAAMGCGAYTFHTGAGIRGGGVADLARGRVANFLDDPMFPAQVAALKAVGTLLPADLANWEKAGSHWANNPLDAYAVDPDEHVTSSYAAVSGNRFLEFPLGINGALTYTAKRAMVVEAYDPTTAVRVAVFTLAAGGTFVLNGPERGGLGGYVVIGR